MESMQHVRSFTCSKQPSTIELSDLTKKFEMGLFGLYLALLTKYQLLLYLMHNLRQRKYEHRFEKVEWRVGLYGLFGLFWAFFMQKLG